MRSPTFKDFVITITTVKLKRRTVKLGAQVETGEFFLE